MSLYNPRIHCSYSTTLAAAPVNPEKDLAEEFKKLQKQVVDGHLPCKKREAIHLAGLQLAVRMGKVKPDEIKKKKKVCYLTALDEPSYSSGSSR